MKITFFIGGLIGGGAERVTCNLSNYLVSKGHNVQILTMSDTDSYFLDSKVDRHVLLRKEERGNVIRNYFRRYHRLKKYLKSDDSDCYVVMLPITIILLLLMKKQVKAPIIAAERCYPPVLPRMTQKLLLFFADRASAWVFQTVPQKEWYGKHIKGCLTTLIPNAVNITYNNRERNEKSKTVVAVGRLCESKNYELLISSYAKIVDTIPGYNLVIYGEGELRPKLELLIKNLGVAERILLPGYDNNVYEKISKASLYVLSSNNEGIPNTLIEAMALGVPCVSTDCKGGGAKLLIDNEINGLLVPRGDEQALASAISRMLSDRQFAEQCGREAFKIRERLAPEKIYGEWEKFIIQIVNS